MFGVSNSHTHNLCDGVDLAFALVGHGHLHGAGGGACSGAAFSTAAGCEDGEQRGNGES